MGCHAGHAVSNSNRARRTGDSKVVARQRIRWRVLSHVHTATRVRSYSLRSRDRASSRVACFEANDTQREDRPVGVRRIVRRGKEKKKGREKGSAREEDSDTHVNCALTVNRVCRRVFASDSSSRSERGETFAEWKLCSSKRTRARACVYVCLWTCVRACLYVCRDASDQLVLSRCAINTYTYIYIYNCERRKREFLARQIVRDE